MSKQLSLFETSPPHHLKYNVFLAIFPDHYTSQQIIVLGNALRQTHGLQGRLRPINHLHVSLLFLGHASEVPDAVVETVGHVCKAVTAVTSPFEIKFDRVLSFRGRPGNQPLVLGDDNRANGEVRKLHGLLSTTCLKYFSLPYSPPKFLPHLTLLYDKQELASKSIESVSWTVEEIVLVRSEVGATKYQWLGHWAFGR